MRACASATVSVIKMKPCAASDSSAIALPAAWRFTSSGDCVREISIGGDEDGEGFGVVLGLGDEVGGDADGVAILAGDDDFGGTGGHIDAGFVGDGDFGSGDVEVAGADDLVDRLDCLCAIR